MADRRERFIRQLENAARRVEVMAPAEAARLFHRAALRLRNIDGPVLDIDVDEALGSVAENLREAKHDLIRRILREWLEANAYLPVLGIEEDAEVEGTA